MNAVRRWLRSLYEAMELSVPGCLFCGRPLQYRREQEPGLCLACQDRIAWVQGEVCPRCGKPLHGRDGPCADCSRRPVPFAFSRAVAVYDGIWKELILQFKFYGRRELARPLGW